MPFRWLASLFTPRRVEVLGQPADAPDAENWGEFSPVQIWVGLGNPGAQYAMQRHNAGYMAVDAIAEIHEFEPDRKAFAGWTRQGRIGGQRILILKPGTYMNKSGLAVVSALNYYKIEPAEMLVAHDELDLPPGTARLKFGGGHGGQNGLRDLLEHLGHGDFHRLRIGIGHPGHKDRVTPWVLGRPGKADENAMLDAIADALAVTALAVGGQFNDAMKQLHTPRPAAAG